METFLLHFTTILILDHFELPVVCGPHQRRLQHRRFFPYITIFLIGDAVGKLVLYQNNVLFDFYRQTAISEALKFCFRALREKAEEAILERAQLAHHGNIVRIVYYGMLTAG